MWFTAHKYYALSSQLYIASFNNFGGLSVAPQHFCYRFSPSLVLMQIQFGSGLDLIHPSFGPASLVQTL